MPDLARASVWTAVGLILAVTLVSGPLVGAVDLTHERENEAAPGSGSANATVVSVPDRVVLDKGAYGSGSYYLQVPDAVVNLTHVSSQPLLVYKLYIRELGYSHGTTHFLSPRNEGRMSVSLSRDALAPEEIQQDRYRGELLLLVRDDSGDQTLAAKNVTVLVRK